MRINLRQIWQGYDGVLTTVTLMLLFIGLALHYVSSLNEHGDMVDFLFVKQITAASIGLGLMFLVGSINFNFYRSWSKWIYSAMIVILVAVLFLGVTIRGTTGWFVIGGLSFQPVELARILFILALAAYIIYIGPPLTTRKTIIDGVILLPPLLLVLAQPDFGAAALLIVSFLTLLAAVPKKWSWWIGVGLVVMLVLVVGWFNLEPYQKDRIQVFLNPQLDPLNRGYNVSQSIIAVGSGQWLGRGLGLGTQSRLDFLPEQQTDFIFASIAEELGFFGASLVIGLFVVFFYRLIYILRRVREDYSFLVATGLISIFFIQVILNIGMNLGLTPVIGLPLPFLSAGGSSLIASLISVGMIQNLARHYLKQAPAEDIA